MREKEKLQDFFREEAHAIPFVVIKIPYNVHKFKKKVEPVDGKEYLELLCKC